MSQPRSSSPTAKLVFLLLVASGAVMIIVGSIMSVSVASSFARLFSAGTVDSAIVLLIAGVALAATGLTGLVRGTRTFLRPN